MTLANLLLDAATENPNGVSVIGLQDSFNWAQTYNRAKSLALQLVAAGVVPGDRVAVMRTKSHYTFEAIHAVLMAGGVLVPTDPLGPAKSAQAVLADAGVVAVIGDVGTVAKFDPWAACAELKTVLVAGEPGDARTTQIDEGDERSRLAEESGVLPEIGLDEHAYLVYTSGSTGEPKGILHTHRSGLAYARLAVAEHDMGPQDRLAATCAAHFDMGTLELYAAPLAQTTIVIFSEAHLRFPASFTERAQVHRATMFYAVTTLLQSIVDRGALDQRNLSSVTKILFAGEVYPPASLVKLMAAFPRARFANVYGPAEVNACNVHHLDGPPDPELGAPIGPAWPGAEMMVVDEDEQPLDQGEKGELWVSAVTRMKHYWGQPELTAAKTRHRSDGPDWYMTGDIVSQDADGVFWFHGRKDNQVKIRGVRIELEAVEAVLGEAPGVLYAVAAARKVGEETQLVASLVPAGGQVLDHKSVRRFCQNVLHPSAIPQALVTETSFPQTASGKIDRTAVRAALAVEPSHA
jgi:amino acid adenylation domain-containing protein